MVAIDLGNQLKLDTDSKSIQQINFTWNLGLTEDTAMFFILEEKKETILDF